jgi:hypothetical protein
VNSKPQLFVLIHGIWKSVLLHYDGPGLALEYTRQSWEIA